MGTKPGVIMNNGLEHKHQMKRQRGDLTFGELPSPSDSESKDLMVGDRITDHVLSNILYDRLIYFNSYLYSK